MTKRRWTRKDQEAQDRDNALGTGCLAETAGQLADSAGCLAIGCLANAAGLLLLVGLWTIG